MSKKRSHTETRRNERAQADPPAPEMHPPKEPDVVPDQLDDTDEITDPDDITDDDEIKEPDTKE